MRRSTNGRNGRGRFTKGNAGGPGNPHVAMVGRWRAVLVETVTDDDIRAVVAELVQLAKAGAPWAVRELLDRCIGKAQPEQPSDGHDDQLTIVVEHVNPTLLDGE